MSTSGPSLGYVSQQIMPAAVYYQKCDLEHKKYSQLEKLKKFVIVFADWACSKASPDYRTIKNQTLASRNITQIDSTTTPQLPVTALTKTNNREPIADAATSLKPAKKTGMSSISKVGAVAFALFSFIAIISRGGFIPNQPTSSPTMLPTKSSPSSNVTNPRHQDIADIASYMLDSTNTTHDTTILAQQTLLSKKASYVDLHFSNIEINEKDPIAQNRLGMNYLEGRVAQNLLGMNYLEGRGVTQNYEEAVKWFQLAANQGYAVARNGLGWCYSHGRGVKQNYEEAVRLYELAANQGYAAAQSNLGRCYQEGRGVKQNYEEAFKLFQLAANQGYAAAQSNLGRCYEEGLGVKQNYTEAVRLYTLAAKQGNAAAQNNLGWCYLDGKGVTQSDEEGVWWVQLAAKQGDADSQVVLGWCYEGGIGVKQDSEKAVKWIQLAANQGHAYAKQKLLRLRSAQENK